jgi:hypothetical protein
MEFFNKLKNEYNDKDILIHVKYIFRTFKFYRNISAMDSKLPEKCSNKTKQHKIRINHIEHDGYEIFYLMRTTVEITEKQTHLVSSFRKYFSFSRCV